MSRPRSIRVSDEDWAEVQRRAEATGETATAYLLRRALEPDRVGDLRRVLRAIARKAEDALLP